MGRSFLGRCALLLGTFFSPNGLAERICLPTDNVNVFDADSYVQPTCATKKNGGFGLVRENGTRFHGGIDIRPVCRDSANEPMDEVRSVADGIVRYINFSPEKSSLGVYVIVEHDDFSLPIHSLYAHLARIDEQISVGKRVRSGTPLGIMGRTDGTYQIPKQFAHLHFELGLRLGTEENFASWYGRHCEDSPNPHGQWNYLNFVSFDPLPPLQMRQFPLLTHVQCFPTAFKTRVPVCEFPDFLRRYAQLLEPHAGGEIIAFDIEWTWFGLPKRWNALMDANLVHDSSVRLLEWDGEWLALCLKRKTLERTENGTIRLGTNTLNALEKIFSLRYDHSD
ncbi:MAG: M23 family metallopeptidase [Puniceicoccales bacterium]|nr:M23 family metallopeptidase [Puniceicoccales bacterium]